MHAVAFVRETRLREELPRLTRESSDCPLSAG